MLVEYQASSSFKVPNAWPAKTAPVPYPRHRNTGFIKPEKRENQALSLISRCGCWIPACHTLQMVFLGSGPVWNKLIPFVWGQSSSIINRKWLIQWCNDMISWWPIFGQDAQFILQWSKFGIAPRKDYMVVVNENMQFSEGIHLLSRSFQRPQSNGG